VPAPLFDIVVFGVNEMSNETLEEESPKIFELELKLT
jgi:hypothetical protein